MQMKFKAHQTFAIRKGWLGKGLRGIQNVSHTLLMPSSSKEAMDELGLGSNQVVALRYWLETLGLIKRVRRNREHDLTETGQLILDNDPYTEEIGTLWALQCNLASARQDATSWYYFFNEFRVTGSFDREDFTRALEHFIFSNGDGQKISLTSLDADFSCILNTYIPHDRTSNRHTSPESVIDCPLGELGLVDVENRSTKTYRKKPANLGTLPSALVLYSICPSRMQLEDDGDDIERELKLEALLDGPCMPGRVYNLDSVALLTKLYELENEGMLRINRTAGLDVIRLTNPRMTKEDCLANYYKMIG